MKGTTTMSKIKRSLSEDFSVLQGDELDGSPDIVAEVQEAQIGVGHAMHSIDTSISFLEKNPELLLGEEDHLRAYADRLQDLAAKAGIPF